MRGTTGESFLSVADGLVCGADALNEGNAEMPDGVATFFTRVLGLQAPWEVEKVSLDSERKRIDFTLSCDAQHLECPVCGLSDQGISDQIQRDWPYMAFFQYEAWLHAQVPRVACSGCKNVTPLAMPLASGSNGLPQPPHGRPQRLKGLRVLAVDDVATNQMVIKHLLSSEGALVSLAANCQQGVAAVLAAKKEQAFDVVLMDIQMPFMDGYEATRRIRSVPQLAQLPIIALTANVQPSDREACFAAGMNQHVGKPFDLNELITVILSVTGPKSGEHAAESLMLPAQTATAAAPEPTAPPIHVYWVRSTPSQPVPDAAALRQKGVVLQVLKSVDVLALVIAAGAPAGLVVMDLVSVISAPMRALTGSSGAASLQAMRLIALADAASETEMLAGMGAGAVDLVPHPFALNHLDVIGQRYLNAQGEWRVDESREIIAIDSQGAMERTESDWPFFSNLLRAFFDELPVRTQQIQDDWRVNPKEIKHHSHALKGLAMTLGLHQLADVAVRTEAHCAKGGPLDRAFLVQLEGELQSAGFQILRWLNLHKDVAELSE